MRVGFDISCINAPMGGYERYVRSLLGTFARDPHAPDLVVLTDRRYGPTIVPAHPRITTRRLHTLSRFVLKTMIQDQWQLPLVMRRLGVDVVHSPVFAGMGHAPRPYVLTLHDLIPLQQPASLSRSAAWYWRTILPRSVRRADRILTVSEFSRREILRHFDLPSDRVVAIPLAVDPAFLEHDTAAAREAVRARYRLPDVFLLFVGITSPRKNLPRIVDAFAALPVSVRGNAVLVLAGPTGWGNDALDAAVARAAPAARVQRIGVVDERDLPVLYRLARGVVSISLQEGFALPALEALASGTPLACADGTAYPELVDACALRVDPRDTAAITDALATLLEGGPEVEERRRRGRDRAAIFRWDRTAEATRVVYESVAR